MEQKQENLGLKTKYLEPTYHFLFEQLKIGEDYSEHKVQVSELVRPDQLLADFPHFKLFASKGYEKTPIEPGDNCHFSDDKQSIFATVSGYPKVTEVKKGDSTEVITILSIEPLFVISPDKMKVSLAIHPPLKKGNFIQLGEINQLLEEANISYGVHHEIFEEVREFLAEGELEFRKFIIAHGQQVGTSKDAYLRFDIEIGPIAGTILENGTIDYRERRIMVGISKDQCIATKIAAVQGEPGINVFGEETPAPEGKDLKVSVLNDARFDAETMQVTATKNGVLSIVNNNVIKVLSHQTISGDVDFETGNVESMNAVTITGSVNPAFKVNVGGDLKIVGNVMSANIVSEGNLVIQGGTTGKNTHLESKGDADINFIEQGQLQCGGMAVIRKQAYYSDIFARSHIRCQNDSVVIGGKVIAEGNVSLGNVGSADSTPSIIAAGTIAERLQQLDHLKISISEQQDAIIQWLQLYKGSSRSKKIRNMEQKLEESKLQLLRLNLIPGTGKYSKSAGPDEILPENSEDYKSDGGIPIEQITIDVIGSIRAGTEIRIGNRTLKLEKNVSGRQFKLNAGGKRILSKPLQR